ncbi:MAG: hypothetical protein IT374_26845 [Polyangiaceae bacterium]|nr:hypothetical protein [Polyangiaceae bacterium]
MSSSPLTEGLFATRSSLSPVVTRMPMGLPLVASESEERRPSDSDVPMSTPPSDLPWASRTAAYDTSSCSPRVLLTHTSAPVLPFFTVSRSAGYALPRSSPRISVEPLRPTPTPFASTNATTVGALCLNSASAIENRRFAWLVAASLRASGVSLVNTSRAWTSCSESHRWSESASSCSWAAAADALLSASERARSGFETRSPIDARISANASNPTTATMTL